MKWKAQEFTVSIFVDNARSVSKKIVKKKKKWVRVHQRTNEEG